MQSVVYGGVVANLHARNVKLYPVVLNIFVAGVAIGRMSLWADGA